MKYWVAQIKGNLEVIAQPTRPVFSNPAEAQILCEAPLGDIELLIITEKGGVYDAKIDAAKVAAKEAARLALENDYRELRRKEFIKENVSLENIVMAILKHMKEENPTPLDELYLKIKAIEQKYPKT